MFTRINKYTLLLCVIILLGALARISGINWDSGFHFHPDERMLIMVADRIHFWSQMNPDFFNYGSLPVYVLVGISQSIDWFFGTMFNNYDGLLIVGRWISTIADLMVVLLVYKIALQLSHKKNTALWSAFFYAVAFFPIQNSHFFIVDTFLNLFSTLLIYQLLVFRNNPSYRRVILIGITFATAITSKVSAILFLPVILLVLLYPPPQHENIVQKILHLFQKKVLHNSQGILTILKKDMLRLVLFGLVSLAFSFLFMPYAFIEYKRFMSDILQQLKMNSDPYIFPYTLQYVDTLPYWYYLKNIFLWGLGPVISMLGIIGLIRLIYPKYQLQTTKYIFLLFYLIYFLVIGRSAVKFMRYMLLMYPLFAVLAGYGVSAIQNSKFKLHSLNHLPIKVSRLPVLFSVVIIIASVFWTSLFLNIYSRPNTRIQATAWINQFIPPGSVLGVEHWDDRVPIFDPGNYKYVELTLYDLPDDQNKINRHYRALQSVDYVIIASNRLYTPLQKLDDCVQYKKCYP